MKTSAILLLSALVLLCLHTIRADLPVHCEFPQIKGAWVFQLTDNTYDKTAVAQCDLYKPITATQKIKIDLQGPNVAVSETGEHGTWTLIYDQGFEVRIGKQNYFAYFNYTQDGETVISDCSRTLTGWYHEDKPAARNWGCFRGYKMASTHNSKFVYQADKLMSAANEVVTNDEALIKEINTKQSSWVAGPVKELEGKPLRTLATPIAKFRRDAHKKHVKSMKVFANANNKQQAKDLPASFDWRNVSSVSYVPAVRNQGACGSCYAFATLGMYETRARIQTRNRSKPQYSPQDILSCSKYSQACDGGFPLLVGKHGYDFGFVDESCNPYRADSGDCTNQCDPDNRRYVSDYTYVGGYYGASTEENMMRAIVEDGPITVGVEVYRDFKYYKGGVYHHVQTSFDSDPDPHFEVLNHAVVLVGYGEQNGEKYWILRNSWGEAWGIDGGHMLIRRGVDECGIESEATTGHLTLN